jgi:hypothetical protein
LALRNLAFLPRLAYNAADYHFLGREGLKLVNELIEWYRVYDGQHWVDETGREITPADLKRLRSLDYLPTMIKANLVAWFVDRLAAFMFERPVAIACPAEQIDDPISVVRPEYKPSVAQQTAGAVAAAREKLLYRILKQNLMHEKLLRAATDYFIGGSVCAKLYYDQLRGLRIIWRPRLEFWPIYNTDDIDVLEKIHFTAFVDDETIWRQTYWLQDSSCWLEEAYFTTDLKLKRQIVEPTDLGLPFIPVEVFCRGGLTGETEGRSLVKTLHELNLEIERKLSDNSDSLRFGMFAIKVILGASLPSSEEIQAGEAKPLEIAPNAVWELPGGGDEKGDIKSLEHEFSYREILKDHLETILSLMHRLADVPNISPDNIKGMGQLSGFAIKLLYGPIISATNRNMTVWQPRLQKLLGKALYMLNKYGAERHYDTKLLEAAALGSIYSGELDDLVELKTQMPVPENESELIDREMKKITGLLESIKGAMDNLGVENPEAKLAEILFEKRALNEALGGLPELPEIPEESAGESRDTA